MTITGWLLFRLVMIVIAAILFLGVAFAWSTPHDVNLAWLGMFFFALGHLPGG